MATLYITEFVAVMQIAPGGHPIQIAAEPPVAEQTVAIGGASVQSNPFNAATRFVRLHTDSICSIEIGANPVASATTRRLAANTTEYFAVPATQSFKVAVITNT